MRRWLPHESVATNFLLKGTELGCRAHVMQMRMSVCKGIKTNLTFKLPTIYPKCPQFIKQINNDSTEIEIKVAWTNANAKILLREKEKYFSKLRP